MSLQSFFLWASIVSSAEFNSLVCKVWNAHVFKIIDSFHVLVQEHCCVFVVIESGGIFSFTHLSRKDITFLTFPKCKMEQCIRSAIIEWNILNSRCENLPSAQKNTTWKDISRSIRRPTSSKTQALYVWVNCEWCVHILYVF